jgi:hypothetical protein
MFFQGIKFVPPHSEHAWEFGFGAGFPITSAKDFTTRLVFFAF